MEPWCKRMRDVLIVDDDVAIVEMVSAALELEGVPHRSAHHGAAALALVAEHSPSLILLDINMPVMDGVQFCRELDARQARNGAAIVVMTASRDADRHSIDCAADGVLDKPFDLDDLYAMLVRHGIVSA
jgi:CheY-like chemotaxis protein